MKPSRRNRHLSRYFISSPTSKESRKNTGKCKYNIIQLRKRTVHGLKVISQNFESPNSIVVPNITCLNDSGYLIFACYQCQ